MRRYTALAMTNKQKKFIFALVMFHVKQNNKK